MRQLTFVQPYRLEWRDVPDPCVEEPSDALVRPLAVATCDADKTIIQGQTPWAGPFAFGHEFVGEVPETGPDVRTFRRGDRAIVPYQISCGACTTCEAGRTGDCGAVPNLSMFGFGAPTTSWGGALSDALRIPFADSMLVRLPSSISPEAAASIGDNVSTVIV